MILTKKKLAYCLYLIEDTLDTDSMKSVYNS